MNKHGDAAGDNLLTWYVAYFILLLVFFIGAIYYVMGLQDGAALWEDVYAKEIVRVIEKAQPVEEVSLDVHSLTELALKRGKAFSEIVHFDNAGHTVTVSVGTDKGVSYSYFNDVKIIDDHIDFPAEGKNMLRFVVVRGGAA